MTHNDIMKTSDAFFNNPLLSVDFDKNEIVNSVSTHQMKRCIEKDEELVKIRTKTREIKVSKNHRFFTMGRDPNYFNRHNMNEMPKIFEKYAHELRKKDRVIMIHKLPEPKERLISEDMAQFLGYVMGDGSIEYPHRWAIHMDDQSKECLNEYEKIARRLNFSTTNHYKHKDKDCHRLRCFKKQEIKKMLRDIDDCIHIKKTSTKIVKIPEKVIKSNNKILGRFLRGIYDAEGCVIIDKSLPREFGKICIGMSNEETIEKIKYLLMRFGIECSMPIQHNILKNHYRIDVKDTLSIKNFKENIGFSHPEKMKKLNKINLNFGTKRKIYGDIEIGFITKIENIKENVKYLVDFTVPAYENYVANGFVVHNSRLSSSKKNRLTSNILLKSRKRDLTLMFTSQLLDLLDKRVRKVLDFTAYTILNPAETIGKCFREGTQIIANPEIKNIENVCIGEKVLTHTGNFMPVENTSCRLYDGDLYKILPYYMPFPIEVTGNHPILVAEPSFKKSRKTNWHNDDKFLIDNFFILDSHKMVGILNRTCDSIHARKALLKKNILFSLKWKNAEEITRKDLLAYPIIKNTVDREYIKISDFLDKKEWKTKRYKAKSWAGIKGCILENGVWKNNRSGLAMKDEIKIDNDFLKLAGFYIGDGAVQGYDRNVAFYFNRKEKGNILEVKRLMKNIFGLECKIYENKNAQETYVYVHCILLAKLFLKLFGKYSHNKKMPEWFLLLPEEKLKYVIEGLVLSDGYVRKKTKNIVTTSKILAIQIINSLIRMKKRFNCHHSKPKISKKVNGINDTYSINFDVKNSKFLFFHGDYILYPIKSIEKNNYLGMVYNLQIQNDESYATPSMIAHNCLIFRGGYPKEAMILKTFRFYTNAVFSCYNTNEEIQMTEEDDGQPAKIVFQESPNHPPKYFDTWEACDAWAEAYWAKNTELLSLMIAGQ